MEVLEGEQKPKGAKSRAKQGQTIPRMPCATAPICRAELQKQELFLLFLLKKRQRSLCRGLVPVWAIQTCL